MKGITKKLVQIMALVAVMGLASCTTTPANDGDTTGGGTGTGTDTGTGGGTPGDGYDGGGSGSTGGGYVVQLIASSSSPKAESIKNEFVGEGYKAYVSPIDSGGQTLYRVQVGPYGTEADAQRVLNQMQRRYQKNTHVNSAVVKTVNGQ